MFLNYIYNFKCNRIFVYDINNKCNIFYILIKNFYNNIYIIFLSVDSLENLCILAFFIGN